VHVHPHPGPGPAALGQTTSKRGRGRLLRQGELLLLCFAPSITTLIHLPHLHPNDLNRLCFLAASETSAARL
jgi:hypothetical protein